MTSQFSAKLKAFVKLTKPGIIRGNLYVAAAGFLLASQGHINLGKLVAMLLGLSLIIASACVVNNITDREIDSKMARTKKRSLVTGQISVDHAAIYASILGVFGFLILTIFTNTLASFAAFIGLLFYVVFYAYFKRRSSWGTLVGAISGATPPVVGYTAVTNSLDGATITLFLIMIFWQMPHFYSIGVYRLKEYKKAGVPILPVKAGVQRTKVEIIFYILAFIAACLSLYGLGYTGLTYLIVMLAVGIVWLVKAVRGYSLVDSTQWGRSMFKYSLLTIVIFSVLISLEAWLP